MFVPYFFSFTIHNAFKTKGSHLMQPMQPINYDPTVRISDFSLVDKLGDAALVGKWFVFLKEGWLNRAGIERLLTIAGLPHMEAKPAILFRGKDEIALPGADI